MRTMQETLNFILNNRYPNRLTIVTFYGGEALLALNKIKWMIQSLRKVLGKNVGFSISSNGYALTPSAVDWLCTIDDCEIYITVDGYEELHDANRRTVSGQSTYRKILSNLQYFKNKYPKEYLNRVNFLVTLKTWKQLPDVSDKWHANIFWDDKIPKHLSFILPMNVEEMRKPVSPINEKREVLDIAFERYKQGERSLLTQQFMEWTDNIHRGMQYVQEGSEITVITCLEDMYRTFISAEGDIYICERFCSEYKIGSVISDRINENLLQNMEDMFIERRNIFCTKCSVAQLCTLCITSLNYSDEELSAICDTERATIELLKEYSWKRRMFDRERQLAEAYEKKA